MPNHLLLGSLLALLALMALAGCGDDDSTTVTEGTTATGGDATSGGESAGEDGAPPAADTEITELTGFSSPSGNIGCLIDRAEVRCDIAEREWEPPPAPAGCGLDYGQGIALTAGGRANFVCAGDTALDPSAEPLSYGSSIAAGLLRCEIERSGVSCRDIETGRGFVLSRAGYELR
jgi:hypothetical protein